MNRIKWRYLDRQFRDPSEPAWFHGLVYQRVLATAPHEPFPLVLVCALLSLVVLTMLGASLSWQACLLGVPLTCLAIFACKVLLLHLRRGPGVLDAELDLYMQALDHVQGELTGHQRMEYARHVMTYRADAEKLPAPTGLPPMPLSGPHVRPGSGASSTEVSAAGSVRRT